MTIEDVKRNPFICKLLVTAARNMKRDKQRDKETDKQIDAGMDK
jgi:hypothetical protein